VCEATTIIGVRSCAELIAERAKEPPTTKPGAVFFRRGRAIQRERQPK
jgi:hypothetical protein